MNLGLDLDGTITDAFAFAWLAEHVRADGGTVHVITAVDRAVVKDSDYTSAVRRLEIAGFGANYDALHIVSKPIARNKADYCKANDIGLFIDNRKKNVKRARKAGVASALYKGRR